MPIVPVQGPFITPVRIEQRAALVPVPTGFAVRRLPSRSTLLQPLRFDDAAPTVARRIAVGRFALERGRTPKPMSAGCLAAQVVDCRPLTIRHGLFGGSYATDLAGSGALSMAVGTDRWRVDDPVLARGRATVHRVIAAVNLAPVAGWAMTAGWQSVRAGGHGNSIDRVLAVAAGAPRAGAGPLARLEFSALPLVAAAGTLSLEFARTRLAEPAGGVPADTRLTLGWQARFR